MKLCYDAQKNQSVRRLCLPTFFVKPSRFRLFVPLTPMAHPNRRRESQNQIKNQTLNKSLQIEEQSVRLTPNSKKFKQRTGKKEEIFSKSSISSSLTPTDVFSYWENLLIKTKLSQGDIGPPYAESRSLDFSQLMSFVTIDEIKQAKLPKNTSPGPDSIPAYALGKIPARIFCKFFTLWLTLKWPPTELNDSRTVFLPKGEDICDPASLRPISITSVITRFFHKVLNNRLLSSLSPTNLAFNPLTTLPQVSPFWRNFSLSLRINWSLSPQRSLILKRPLTL